MVTVNNLFSQLILLCSLSWSMYHVHARIHHLTLKEDTRQYFKVSTFGYLYGGTFRINVDQFSFSPYDKGSTFGFTLLKTKTDGLHPFAKEKDVCILDQENGINRFDDSIGLVSITFDFKRKKAVFRCSQLMKQLSIAKGYNNFQVDRRRRAAIGDDNKPIPGDSGASKVINQPPDPDKVAPVNQDNQPNQNLPEPKSSLSDVNSANDPNNINNDNSNENSVNDNGIENDSDNYCKGNYEIDLKDKVIDGVITYSFEFHTFITDESLAGLYSLYFHSCPNYRSHTRYEIDHRATSVNLSMMIEEKNYDNADNYLSAGEMPLPQLYFTLSIVFFILGLIWIQVIRTRKEDAFKIHYLMGALVFVKALALFFHSIDYHFIAQVGSQNETWAILYYTTHFLKGALLFITIALIGTGWAFVKHILSDKDKKIFMIVIPLQVLANVAEIITEESEEGQFMHNIWRTVFLLVDLICCGAILFPIVWSIRHLQEASQTDGKAAINLLKLKLFRRFYVMIVCYIYFTRIIVFILRLVVPFQFEWLDVFFQHVATLAFFISTGYHFQPTHSNPYFQLAQQEDLEMEEVLFNVTPNIYIANSTKKRTKEKDNDTSEDKQTLITKRDNSHDFE